MIFRNKNKKKKSDREQLFRKEAYIPKSKLNKKERTVPVPGSLKRKGESKKSRKGWGRRVVVSLLWIFFVGEVIYVVLFANFFVIDTIDIQKENNGDQIHAEQIQEYIEGALSGSWYNVISKNNLLLLRKEAMEERISTRYPKLATVDITKQFPHTLKIVITEKPFQIVWCSKEHCLLINDEGKAENADIFFQYPEEQGKVIRIQDFGEAQIQPGRQVVEGEELSFIKNLSKDFSLRTGLSIEGYLERPSIYAKEFRVHTNKGFTIFFNTRLPVDESLNTLMLILEEEIPENEWDKIDYIDLRTENRIYYTRKDKAPEKTEEQKKREEEEQKKREEESKNTQP